MATKGTNITEPSATSCLFADDKLSAICCVVTQRAWALSLLDVLGDCWVHGGDVKVLEVGSQ